MATLRLHRFHLRLRHTFRTARGAVGTQKTLVVELEEDGRHGYGEATTSAYYGCTITNMTAALEAIRPRVESHSLADCDPAALWAELDPALRSNRFAQSALGQAAHDLWGKLHGQPVHRLWGLATDRLPPTSYTIGIDDVDVMVAKLQELPGWPVYKIKLGTPHDLALVETLRRHTDAPFRVDPNCGWDGAETLAKAAALRELGVEFIEQPLPADRWTEMPRLFAESALPLIADESCVVEADVERCHGRFHGVNIKLGKCGGLTPARRMVERAQQLGMLVMAGCMTESSIGISAGAQLLPLLDYADLDGALLLAEDIAAGVTFERGACRFADEPGCGARLLR
jgi:L-alanine-DL-glutamate epimerase-like enolase superfamily enzyme